MRPLRHCLKRPAPGHECRLHRRPRAGASPRFRRELHRARFGPVTGRFTADILRTDGAARTGLFASIGEGRFADEIAVVSKLPQPVAILHGEGDQLVSLNYLKQLTIPTCGAATSS